MAFACLLAVLPVLLGSGMHAAGAIDVDRRRIIANSSHRAVTTVLRKTGRMIFEVSDIGVTGVLCYVRRK